VFILLCAAGFLCCVPMAMPQSHLVAFCSDVGIPITRGAAMLSALLACAFVGRQVWGFVADKVGGLRTILAGSVCQATTMTGFLLTQDEAGLYVVAIAFGLGFSGMIPAYAVAIRELFPAREASWAFRPCCCAAAPVWPQAAGSPAKFMTPSVSTPQPLPPASPSASPIRSSSPRWYFAKAGLAHHCSRRPSGTRLRAASISSAAGAGPRRPPIPLGTDFCVSTKLVVSSTKAG